MRAFRYASRSSGLPQYCWQRQNEPFRTATGQPLIETYRKIFALLDRAERREFLWLVAMSLVLGVIEALGVLSVLPFIALAADPSAIDRFPVLQDVFAASGLETPQQLLFAMGFAVLFIVLGGIGFRILTLYRITHFARGRALSFGSRLLERYLSRPYAWFLTRHTAQLGKNVLSEVDQVVRGSVMNAMRLIAYGAVTFCLIVLVLIVDPTAAAAMGGLLGVAYGAIFIAMRRRLLRLGRERREANRQQFQIVQEALSGIKDVKILHLEQRFLERYRAAASRLAKLRAEISLIGETPRDILEALVFGGMIILVLWILSTRDGTLIDALPVLAIYAVAGVRLFPVLQQLYAAFAAIRADQPALDALHRDLLDDGIRPEKEVHDGGTLHLTHTLELDDVAYAFPKAERPALAGLSLKIDANTTVGLVGRTGAGKTTTVDLLLGLLSPQTGIMRVDGTVVAGANVRAWQRSVGYVPQAIHLVDDTVIANIAFGEHPEEVDLQAVERAARIANLHEFVTGLPQGYESLIGERGARLSGGQRQRVGIARALYRDPDVIVFDEATSALDTVTEKAVVDAVRALGSKKTIVMVAHRLSIVRRCDVIHFLEHGRLVDSGTYKELVARNPGFREMHDAAA